MRLSNNIHVIQARGFIKYMDHKANYGYGFSNLALLKMQ